MEGVGLLTVHCSLFTVLTRCRGPASKEMQLALDLQDDTSAMASMVSLINIESLFSLLIISLIFRFDFSLTIELTFDW